MAKNRESVELRKNGDDQSVEYTKKWEDNGITHRLTVEEVEGGYIVIENRHGHRKSEGEDSQYIDETTKKVTTENPLKKKKEEDPVKSSLMDSIKSNFGDINLI